MVSSGLFPRNAFIPSFVCCETETVCTTLNSPPFDDWRKKERKREKLVHQQQQEVTNLSKQEIYIEVRQDIFKYIHPGVFIMNPLSLYMFMFSLVYSSMLLFFL